MGGFFLNDETYENNDTFLYIILEYDRPNFDRFLHRAGYLNCLARKSLSESTDIWKNHLISIILIAICFQQP